MFIFRRFTNEEKRVATCKLAFGLYLYIGLIFPLLDLRDLENI